MNKRKFISLISLMVLSLGGLIWVQVTWVGNAIKVANYNFDSFVKFSLINTARAVESAQRMNFLNSRFLEVQPTVSSQDSAAGDLSNQVRGSFSGSVTIAGGLVSDVDSVEISVSTNDNPPVTMKVPVESGTVSGGSQQYKVSSDEYQNWLRHQAGEFQSMSSQLLNEVFRWENELTIDMGDLNTILKNNFVSSGIETPFEFAILRADTITGGVYTRTKLKEFVSSPYRVALFSEGLFRKGETLSVVFPHKTNFVLGSIGLILGGYALFSLIILSTFALSLYFIITQKKISEMKSDFINNMTHEFKTPIATISLAADTITNNKVITDEGKVRHFIGMIKKENARMNRQVETILQIATLDKREMEFSYRELDLHDVIKLAVDTVEIQVTERGGFIRCDLGAENSMIRGDHDHLRNLVHNLLDNANKYSEGAPEITVTSQSDSNGITFAVADKGIGMSKAVQSRIFERFYRQTSGNIHNVKGFGLGLNYAKAIIDAHGGTITVESEPGKGSRFIVFLPYNTETR